MSQNLKKITFILFAVAVVATIVVYVVTERDMKYTWIAGGIAIVLYLINRFSK